MKSKPPSNPNHCGISFCNFPKNPCREPAPILPPSQAQHCSSSEHLAQAPAHQCIEVNLPSTLRAVLGLLTLAAPPTPLSPWEGRGFHANFQQRFRRNTPAMRNSGVVDAWNPDFPIQLLPSISESRLLFLTALISKRSMWEVGGRESRSGGGQECQEPNTVFSGSSQQDKGAKGSVNLQQLSALDILTVKRIKNPCSPSWQQITEPGKAAPLIYY